MSSNQTVYNSDKKRYIQNSIIYSIAALLLCLFETFQLNYSAAPSFSTLFNQGIVVFLVNALILIIVNGVLSLFIRRLSVVFAITTVLFTVWSVVDFYVIEFHGSPLFISEFVNFTTAINVAGSYNYVITNAVIGLILIFIVEIGFVLLCYILEKKMEPISTVKRVLVRFFVLSTSCLISYFALFSPFAIKPVDTLGWTWTAGVEKYGYVSCIVEDCYKSMNSYKEPKGDYSVDKIKEINVDNDSAINPDEYPDIILILNETLFDLNIYADVDSDIDVFGPLNVLDGAVYGSAVAPEIGGGTNSSEYELITSNSMMLLNGIAPFTYLRMDENGNNIVAYLKHLGYITTGMHCGIKSNYSRNRAYPQIGFDNIKLGHDDFKYVNSYGNRMWLDWDNYKDMIDINNLNVQKPQFSFLLTFQNHGGYEQNDAEYDIVHTNNDFGDLTDDVNEYLTSVKMSVDAFIKLTEAYKESKKPVIICMVGDHAPSFINDLPPKKQFSFEENEITKRMVPYIIWSNYNLSFDNYNEIISMVDVIPLMIEAAGMPKTPYYQSIINLNKSVPVRLKNGIYMDIHRSIGVYDDESEYYNIMTQYYYMEYNSLRGGKEYKKELFEITG